LLDLLLLNSYRTINKYLISNMRCQCLRKRGSNYTRDITHLTSWLYEDKLNLNSLLNKRIQVGLVGVNKFKCNSERKELGHNQISTILIRCLALTFLLVFIFNFQLLYFLYPIIVHLVWNDNPNSLFQLVYIFNLVKY